MATVLFYNIPATGHSNPSLPLVAEVVRRGVRVVYYNTDPFRAPVEATGAEFRSYGAPYAFEPEPDVAAPFKAMGMILAASEELLPRLIPAARAEQPDLVIYDSMCPWGKQVAQALGVPTVASSAIMLVTARNFRALPPDPRVQLGLLARLPTVLAGLWRYRRIAGRIRRRLGLPSPSPLDFFGNPGDITLVYTSRLFQVGAHLLDDSFKFVGPSIAPRSDAGDLPPDWLKGQVIYVSLGTLFNTRPDFFRACLAAFKDTPYRVVLSIGRKIPLDALGPIPPNCLVRPYVPQLEVLPRTSLFITHGGMNSVNESLWYGVPMLVAPQVGDQYVIAHRVAQLGAGLYLDPQRFTPASLRRDAARVLAAPSFREQSAAIRESFREAGGFMRAADEVMTMLAA